MNPYEACIERFGNVAKPPGSLGRFEALLAKIARAQGTADVDVGRKAALVFCADNGVTAAGVSSHGAEVTAAMSRLHKAGKSAVAVMAWYAAADVFVHDLGATADMTQGAAMRPDEARAAIETGRKAVIELAEDGYRLISIGETGMGNTTTAAAVASVLLGVPPEKLAGRGAGLGDDGLARKIDAIKRAISVNNPNRDDPLDTLAKVGGLDIAAMCGAYLGAAEGGAVCVIDGVISGVAALCASRINPKAQERMIPSHMSAEPAARPVFDALGLEPFIHADMRLGEGTGAVLMFTLIDMIAAVYNDAAKFSDL